MAKGNQASERAIAIANGNGFNMPEEHHVKGSVGQPTLFDEFVVVKVEQLASKGLNNKEIAASLKIGERTLYDWINKYPQLLHAIKKYRGLADIEVENALYKAAVGYTFKETKKEGRKDPKNEGEYRLVVTEEVDKTIGPNPVACIFYLKNRMPSRYKDKIETEISVASDISAIGFVVKRRE